MDCCDYERRIATGWYQVDLNISFISQTVKELTARFSLCRRAAHEAKANGRNVLANLAGCESEIAQE